MARAAVDMQRVASLALLASAWLAACCCILHAPCATAATGKPFAVVGYMPEYRLHNGYNYEEAFAAGLTHVIFFSLEIDKTTHRPAALDRLPPEDILQRARLAADKHGAHLMICFGGNARTAGFPTMVLKKQSRAEFLDALDALMREKGFDGVDYNWEVGTGLRAVGWDRG
jgi:hypothetical protein